MRHCSSAHADPEHYGCRYKSIDYQALRYYSAPKFKKELNSLDEVDPAVLATFEKLGISLNEQARTAQGPGTAETTC